MKVSVIVPVYNDIRLDACLRSLVTQARKLGGAGAELIVVDNGSDTDIAGICKRFVHVIYVRESKAGSYAARNAGLRAARGEIYAFTDADCIPDSEWLQTGLHSFDDPDVQVLAGPIRTFPRPAARPNLVESFELSIRFPVRRYVEERLFGPTANLWMRSTVIREAGPFDERLRSGGDVEWCKRAHGHGFPTRYCERLIVRHPADDNLRAVTRRARRHVGGHFMLARREKRVAELVRKRLWPRWTVGVILSNGHVGLTQKSRALLVELFWLYWVRLVELGRLFAGGEPLR